MLLSFLQTLWMDLRVMFMTTYTPPHYADHGLRIYAYTVTKSLESRVTLDSDTSPSSVTSGVLVSNPESRCAVDTGFWALHVNC